MNRRVFTSLAIVLTMVASALTVTAQSGQWNERYWHRYDKNQVGQLIRNVETSSNEFRRNFDRWLDQSRYDGTTRENNFNSKVRAFEQSTNELRAEFERRDSWWETRNNVQNVLTAARPVEQMMRRRDFDRSVENQWRRLRSTLNRLATTYRLSSI